MVATEDHVRLTPVHALSRQGAEVAEELADNQQVDHQLLLGRTAAGSDPVEQLGILDDAVFEAIAGRTDALVGLKRLWPEIKASLGPTLLEESREQYVRYALRVWRDAVDVDGLHNPAAALAVVDVMSLLFDE
ncbi:MAG TPA: hypothetical protein VHD36_03320 [Pirellulales bacterium]|nr:hypothetical protein [Pirellulales bacterium]